MSDEQTNVETVEEMAARLGFEIDNEATGVDMIFLGPRATAAMQKGTGSVKVAQPIPHRGGAE